MLLVNIILLFFKFVFLTFKTFSFYLLIVIVRGVSFFIFSPFSLFYLIKSFVLLIFITVRALFVFLLEKVANFSVYLYNVHLNEPFYQMLYHLNFSYRILKEKTFRRYYFYRRFYRFYPSLKILVRSVLTVELNALLVKRLVRPLKPTWPKFLNIVRSRTRFGYRLRVARRLIKFFLGVITLVYPFHLLIKFGSWHLTVYLMRFLRFLRRKEILKTKKSTLIFLKLIIWIKLLFVWNELPFIILFKPGISKKFPQYVDIQPDIKVIKPEIWNFALSRDCYFDYDSVLNGYYFFHTLRRLSKFFFNTLILMFVLLYFLILSLLYVLQVLYFLSYIPFKFIYLQLFATAAVLGLKFIFVFFYFVPIFGLLIISVLFYLVLSFFTKKLKYFSHQKPLFFIYFSELFNLKELVSRSQLILFYFIFKVRSTNYILFKDIKNFISLGDLFSLGSGLVSAFSNLFSLDKFYGNLVYYNSSFIFKRVRPYLLRFSNTQFISHFLKIQNTSRITPDQIKAFYKISLNSRYPVYYFERLFDLEYSRLELEYELPYYWSFVRQAHSINQDLLHPKFHVFGLLNYLKFYWNYFSFLNSNSVFDLRSIQAHDFIQLLNSSASQIFSYLMHDFFRLLKVKNFYRYNNSAVSQSNKAFIKLSTVTQSTRWYTLHTKYYDKLLHFFWDYFEGTLTKVVLYYYIVSSNKGFNKIDSFFNNYAEKARHMISWFVFAFYERIMGKVFININKFEDYYDMNFDRSVDHYDFYLKHLRRFFGSPKNRHPSKGEKPTYFSDGLKGSVRFTEYLDRVASQRRKDYTNTISDFFTGSFSFFGHFFIFVRDNVFEFMASWHTVWRDYVDGSITRWYNSKKIVVFIFYFLKFIFIIFFIIAFILVFFLLFFIKRIIIIIVKNLKKLYV